jgi:hypothetical protein
MTLGVMIVLSPWFGERPEHGFAVINALCVGLLVFILAQLEYMTLRRWEETGAFLLGVWLMVSPFVLDYAGVDTLRAWHIVLGAAVAVLAALELWQDWTLSEEDLARYGK